MDDDHEIESNTVCLPKLNSVEKITCPSLKYVLPLTSAQIRLPCLQKLHLRALNDLSSFRIKALALEHLDVSGCPGLSNLPIQQDKLLQSKVLLSLCIFGFLFILFEK